MSENDYQLIYEHMRRREPKKNSTNEYHKNEQHKTTTNLQKQQRNTTPIHKSNNKDGFPQVSLAEYA